MSSIPSWFVIVMGIGTVFVGLICIILLCKLLGVACSYINPKQESNKKQQTNLPMSPAQQKVPAANRQEIIAAIGAAIAEECGVDVNGIRILSIKRI